MDSDHWLSTPAVCSNSSYWIVARVISVLTLIMTVVTNILLLLVTWRAKNELINPFLLGSLAMSDLLTGVFVLPFHVTFAFQEKDASPGHSMCTLSGVMFHILQMVSLFSFFALSFDRFFSIVYPIQHLIWLTDKVNMINISVIWLVPPMLYGAIPVTDLGVYVFKCWQSMCNLGPVNFEYLTFMMLFSVSVFMTTYFINGWIFYIARKKRKIAGLEDQFKAITGHRSIAQALGLFTLCWGPYYTALFCFVLFGVSISPETEFALLWLAISNSYMNLFVFILTYRTFRRHFLRMLDFRDRQGKVTDYFQGSSKPKTTSAA